MRCIKCNNLIYPADKFCPYCGEPNAGYMQVDKSQVNMGNNSAQNISIKKNNNQNAFFKRLWNSEKFTEIAIKFDQISNWIETPLYIIAGIIFLILGGFWFTIIGIFCFLSAITCICRIFTRMKRRKTLSTNVVCPSCGNVSNQSLFCPRCGEKLPKPSVIDVESNEELTEENIKSKKQKLFWGPLVYLFLILLILGGFVSDMINYYPVEGVKEIQFDNYNHNIDYWVKNGIKNPKWDAEKISDGSYYVTVKGYYPPKSDDVILKFRYEEFEETYSVTPVSITFIDSNETYSDPLTLGVFYNILDNN